MSTAEWRRSKIGEGLGLSEDEIKLVERARNLSALASRSRTPSPQPKQLHSPYAEITITRPSTASPSPSRVADDDAEDTRRIAHLTRIFREFDLDGSDTVDEDELLELGRARRSLGHKTSDWTPEKNRKMMRSMDSSGSSNTVNCAEFINYFKRSLQDNSSSEFDVVAQQFLQVARACREKKKERRGAVLTLPKPVTPPRAPVINLVGHNVSRPVSPPSPARSISSVVSVVSHLASAAVMTDSNGKITSFNKSAATALGVHSMNGRMFVDHCVAPGFQANASRAIDRAAHGEAAQADIQLLMGSIRGMSLVAVPRTTHSGSNSDQAAREPQLLQCFEAFDVNGNGVVDVHELLLLGRMRRTLGQRSGEWTPAKNSKLLQALDPTSSGGVTSARFVRYFDSKLPADLDGFKQSVGQFLEVATAVRAVRDSGGFDPDQLADRVEEYCTQHACLREGQHSPPQGRGNVMLLLLPEGGTVRELETYNTRLKEQIAQLESRPMSSTCTADQLLAVEMRLDSQQERNSRLVKQVAELEQELRQTSLADSNQLTQLKILEDRNVKLVEQLAQLESQLRLSHDDNDKLLNLELRVNSEEDRNEQLMKQLRLLEERLRHSEGNSDKLLSLELRLQTEQQRNGDLEAKQRHSQSSDDAMHACQLKLQLEERRNAQLMQQLKEMEESLLAAQAGGNQVKILELRLKAEESRNAQLLKELEGIAESTTGIDDEKLRVLELRLQSQETAMMQQVIDLESQLQRALDEIKILKASPDGSSSRELTSYSPLDIAVIAMQDNEQLTVIESNGTANHRLGSFNQNEQIFAQLSRSCHEPLLNAVAAVRRGQPSGVVNLCHVANPTAAPVGFTLVHRNSQLLLLSLDATWMTRPGQFLWEMDRSPPPERGPAPILYPHPSPLPMWAPPFAPAPPRAVSPFHSHRHGEALTIRPVASHEGGHHGGHRRGGETLTIHPVRQQRTPGNSRSQGR